MWFSLKNIVINKNNQTGKDTVVANKHQEDEFRGFKVKDELYILFPLTIYGDGEYRI